MPQSYSGGRNREQQIAYNNGKSTYDTSVGGIQYLAGGKSAVDDQALRDFEAWQQSQWPDERAWAQRGVDESRARLSDDQAWRMGQMRDSFSQLGFGDLLSGAGGAGGSGGGGGFITGGGGAPSQIPQRGPQTYGSGGNDPGAPTRVPGVESPDMTSANAQIFGAAKDQVGTTGRASLQSLRDELGASGMLGSGGEVQGARDIVQGGMGQLGDVSRANAINESGQKADFAKMKYQGDITQRGQDIAQQEANARLQLQRELARQQMLLEILRNLNGGMGSGGGSTGGSSGGSSGSGTSGTGQIY